MYILPRLYQGHTALEERAQNCYGGSMNLGKDEFVQMILFDGCFIVEVIR